MKRNITVAAGWRSADSGSPFQSAFWLDPFKWPDDADAPLMDGYARSCPTPFVFLARAIQRLAEVAPADLASDERNRWAGEAIVQKRLDGELRTRARCGQRWLDIADKSWAHRQLFELNALFAKCSMDAEPVDWFVFVHKGDLERLIEKARAIANAVIPANRTSAAEARELANLLDLTKQAIENGTPLPVKARWFETSLLGTLAKRRVWDRAREKYAVLSSLKKPKTKRNP